jgi:hypothetical protein
MHETRRRHRGFSSPTPPKCSIDPDQRIEPNIAPGERTGNYDRTLPPVGDRAVADKILKATLAAIRELGERDFGGIIPPVEAIYASLNVIGLAIAPQPVASSPANVQALCNDIAARLQTIILQHQRRAAGRFN